MYSSIAEFCRGSYLFSGSGYLPRPWFTICLYVCYLRIFETFFSGGWKLLIREKNLHTFFSVGIFVNF